MDSSSNEIGNINFTPPSAPLIRLTLLAALLALSILTGCSVDTASNEEPVPVEPDVTSIVIEVDFAAATAALTDALTDPLFNAATAAEVDSATVQAYQPFPNSVGFADMQKKPGSTSIWSGILTDLPVGVALDFDVQAQDFGGIVIFEGFTEGVVLTGSEDPNTPSETVSITPTPASTEAPVIIDIRIGSCSLLDPLQSCPVMEGVDAVIVVEISGLPGELLTVDFPLENPANAFVPFQETFLTDASGLPRLIPDFTYSAPLINTSTDSRTQTVRVTNDRNIATTESFLIDILNSTAVSLNFAPVVTGFSAIREAGTDKVTWQATVNDDQDAPTALTHSWSFTQTSVLPTPPTFDDGDVLTSADVSDANPAVMVLYDETAEGTVTLNVTDSGGVTTTVTIPVPAGQFPDAVGGGL